MTSTEYIALWMLGMRDTKRKINNEPLVCLASESAQRRAILEGLGLSYQLLKVEVDEIVATTATETAEENAIRKLTAGLRISGRGAIVVGADTVLEAQGQVLGKPADKRTAVQYLQMLSSNNAMACSAVAVMRAGADEGSLATETAKVHFKFLSQDIISWYVSTMEPMGRAGAFGIEGLGEILTSDFSGGGYRSDIGRP